MVSRSLMIQGTQSDAGKTMLVTALCRIFARQGWDVMPYKSQNMSLNTYLTPEHKQMSLSQALQCMAAGKEATVDANPIILKVASDIASDLIFQGERIGEYKATTYFQAKPHFKEIIRQHYYHLSQQHQLMIIEGAGSPAEINLNDHDFVNMGIAEIAQAPVILIADIERGGVFASIYGTIKLLPKNQQSFIKGIIINKFRGDISLLESGCKMIEQRVDVPVIGVIPYVDFQLPSEDSLNLRSLRHQDKSQTNFDIAIIGFPRIENSHELHQVSQIPDSQVRLVEFGNNFGQPDLVIIPSVNQATENIDFLKERQLWNPLKDYQGHLIGLGSGGQLLYDQIKMDQSKSLSGLGQITGSTQWNNNLTRRSLQVETFHLTGYGSGNQTYSHQGKSYDMPLHNLFSHKDWLESHLNLIRAEHNLPPIQIVKTSLAQQIEELANHIEDHLNLEQLIQIINQGI